MAKAIAVNGETRTAVPQWKQGPDRFINFLKEVRGEMRKVVTPSRQEVQTTTTVVIITVFLFAAYFYIVDAAVGRAMQALLATLTK
ncbi:MAG TPA: preprotein translocase subunit SecE [Acidobacteriaceae bacterium]|nr:preprotein translocase subunit SecE [Acidobacteriaceae bacterium]